MANSFNEKFGSDQWFSRVRVTATGRADLKIPPTATAVGRNRRLVVEFYSIVGHNTNAAATVFEIRNKTTTTSVLLGGSMLPNSGSCSLHQNGVWLPGQSNETIEINVTGSITGAIDITLGGRILPDDFPSTRNYTGAP